MPPAKKKMFIIILVLVVSLFIVGSFLIRNLKREILARPVRFGVTFSKIKAENLGLSWRETYLAILYKLGVKFLRLGAYWPELEPRSGFYDFSSLDWQIEEAEAHGAEIIIVVGRRLPGWPECHIPGWAKDLSEFGQQGKILNLVKETISRYKGHSSIWAWQVENEPFLNKFGICPRVDRNFFERELALVRSLDKRPVIVSESGELSTWVSGAHYADILGITIYRAVWNKYFKYLYYPFPAFSYWLKGELVKFLTGIKEIVVVELQAEPWSSTGELATTSLEEQARTMNFERFKDVVDYAQNTGFSRFYFWGAEWWYWLTEQGDSRIWDYAKDIFTKPEL